MKRDGSILLVYKSTFGRGPLRLGVAGAEDYTKPFERVQDDPILETALEDPYIWWNGTKYEMVLKEFTGEIGGAKGGGIHATSDDGVDWKISEKPQAYAPTVALDDGTSVTFDKCERPQVLVEAGVPTHLFVAVGKYPPDVEYPGYHALEKTWNMCIPLAGRGRR